MNRYGIDLAHGAIAELGILRMRLIVSARDAKDVIAVTDFRGLTAGVRRVGSGRDRETPRFCTRSVTQSHWRTPDGS